MKRHFILVLSLCVTLSAPALAQSRIDSIRIETIARSAHAQEDLGNFDSAISLDQKILEIVPNRKQTFNAIGALFGKKGDYEAEKNWARKTLDLDAKDIDAYINYGNAFAGEGDLDSATEELTFASQLAPSNPLPTFNLGLLAESRQDVAGALSYYRKSIQIDPNFASGYYNLAMMQANMGNFTEARKNLEKVLELNPKDDQTRGVLEDMKNTPDHMQR